MPSWPARPSVRFEHNGEMQLARGATTMTHMALRPLSTSHADPTGSNAATIHHMWFQTSVTALLLQVAPTSEPRLAASPRATAAAVDAAGHAVLNFLTTWRTAWLESVDTRGFGYMRIRLRDVHCHWDGSYRGGGASGNSAPPSIIHHSSRRSMCPNWLPTNEQTSGDERLDRDAALALGWRERVHERRQALIDSLGMLAEIAPGDAWITGQRVRFLLDQGNSRAAIGVARKCAAERAWCAQLAGFAFHAARDFARADSAFDAASAAMSPKERCEWTSARPLLDSDGRSAYGKLNCDERAAANERLWWLATPLFSDTIADRRSEHLSRKVLIRLHSALSWDERYDWRGQFGGEAVSEMLVRYGWPSFSAFTGVREEADHASWMRFYDSTRTATAEYPQDRLHLLPEWSAVNDPFNAEAEAWQINMPPLKGGDEPAAQWWPAEHYGRAAGSIVQLRHQTALLRRDKDLVLAIAAELGSAGSALGDDTAAAVLIRTTAPRTVERVPRRAFRNATAVVLTGRIPSSPAVVGTELPAARPGELSARTRLGIVPPPTLAALGPGETAISEPVLISTEDAPPTSPDDALRNMLGSTRVRGPKVGVYWETYGYSANDSVDVTVVIARHERLSKMRRLGMLLHVAGDINGSVAVRWTEPQAGHDSWAIPGRVPILARSIRVDLSRIEPGPYTVEVLVGRRGAVPVRSIRQFVYEGK
jgi:hypothetical protein